MGSLRFPSPSLAAAASSSRWSASKPAHPHATRERLLSTARARAPSRAVEKSRLLLLLLLLHYFYYYYYSTREPLRRKSSSRREALLRKQRASASTAASALTPEEPRPDLSPAHNDSNKK